MNSWVRPVVTILGTFTVLLGLVYPLALTGFARVVFPHESSGSIVGIDEPAQGSLLIGQQFRRPEFFWGRPSAISPAEGQVVSSGGSNLGALNPRLFSTVRAAAENLRKHDPTSSAPIPVDLVTTSASGLDPHISPAAAYFQVPRIAGRRGLSESVVRKLVAEHVESEHATFFAEPRVNVLRLNLALIGLERPSRQ